MDILNKWGISEIELRNLEENVKAAKKKRKEEIESLKKDIEKMEGAEKRQKIRELKEIILEEPTIILPSGEPDDSLRDSEILLVEDTSGTLLDEDWWLVELDETIIGPKAFCEYCGESKVLSPCYLCQYYKKNEQDKLYCRGCGSRFCKEIYTACKWL